MFFENLTIGEILIVIGLVSLAMEILFFGGATIILLFYGLSSIAIGILHKNEIVQTDAWQVLFSYSAGLAIIFTVLLWKPLKKYQNKTAKKNHNSSDFLGHEFILSETLKLRDSIQYKFTGIEWQVYGDDSVSSDISKGTKVQVIKIAPGKLWVKEI